jgi:hypothetical protein
VSRLIAAGRHGAVCRSVQWAWTSGDNAKEYAAVEFEIDGPDDPDAGRLITWFGFFTDKTVDKTIEALRYLGWTGTDLAELPRLAAAGDLAQVVEIVVVHEEYNGEVNAKVRWVNKPGAGRVKIDKPMTADEVRMFSARMRARLAAGATDRGRPGGDMRPSSPTRQPSSGAHAFDRSIPPPGQDDLPF